MPAVFLDTFEFMDAPGVLDASVTPIPAANASVLEVVHTLSTSAVRVKFHSSIDGFVGLYKGQIGSEVQIGTIVTGSEPIDVTLKKGERVSLRSMDAAISTGNLVLEFVRPSQ